ncbi:MAG TPA: DUF4242 domain-containing protein [Chitinophagaceae bacterium]|nr:DUF4242 domain-containing protein [Chitinophagaceae bacterium]
MKTISHSILLFAIIFFAAITVTAQTSTNNDSKTTNATTMKTYLIERDIPNAGKLTGEQLRAISQKSVSVLREMGPEIQWIQSYVTDDKIFCVYRAENEDLIREHARKGGFPVTKITEVDNMISPFTAKN